MTLEKDSLLLNRYRIVDVLGQGGMGSVYRAIDENLGVHVALKENLFTTDEYSRQFRLEAVILANLRHPNLPRVSDHIVLGDEGQYLVMDFIEGEDLRYRMERLGMLSEDDAVYIGAAICDALLYLHTRKPPILHRDIKPGNVKITPDGHIYLVDFGLAKVYQSASQATTTGARAMTPGYSPPEQYGTARTDPRTDIYSLGATLYAALTGVIPEDGLARAMDNAQLTPLRKRNPKVSKKLAVAIEKAMAVDPSDRFQRADEFKKALLGAKSKTQQVTGSYTVVPPPPDTVPPASLNEPGEENEDLAVEEKQSPNKPPRGPVPPEKNGLEDQPFISPLKRQKERERKRRLATIRFFFVLLLLVVIVIPFIAPGILPANMRGMLPFLPQPATQTPTATLTLVPTETLEPTLLPTDTPTDIPSPTATLTLAPTNTLIPLTDTITPTPAPSTQLGGGSGQIAFASARTGVPQIYLVDVAGENAVQITDTPNGACQPSWSPDGMRLVFTSPCKGTDDIYYNSSIFVVNVDGTGQAPIAASPGGNFDPDWSPDGQSILFTSLRTGQMEIFSVNVSDPTQVTQITNAGKAIEARYPAWSHDGSRIVYSVRRFNVYQIWIMNADGTDPKQIVRSGVAYTDYQPAWSPDGSLIIFDQRCATTFCNPYLMSFSANNLEEVDPKRMQLNLVTIENVNFSPDGFYLAYESIQDTDNLDIFLMTVAGGDRVRLTTDKGLDFHPAWRPAVATP